MASEFGSIDFSGCLSEAAATNWYTVSILSIF